MEPVTDDHWCFACGRENPHGLRLQGFRPQGEWLVVDFTPGREHQGWREVTHGGLVATVLDEVMTWLLYRQGLDAVTAELAVRYHHPLPTGHPVQARARETLRRGRLVRAEAQLVEGGGRVLASAEGKFLLVQEG